MIQVGPKEAYLLKFKNPLQQGSEVSEMIWVLLLHSIKSSRCSLVPGPMHTDTKRSSSVNDCLGSRAVSAVCPTDLLQGAGVYGICRHLAADDFAKAPAWRAQGSLAASSRGGPGVRPAAPEEESCGDPLRISRQSPASNHASGGESGYQFMLIAVCQRACPDCRMFITATDHTCASELPLWDGYRRSTLRASVGSTLGISSSIFHAVDGTVATHELGADYRPENF